MPILYIFYKILFLEEKYLCFFDEKILELFYEAVQEM